MNKFFAIAAMAVTLTSMSSFAGEVASNRKAALVNVARIVNVINLVNNPNIMVNVSVQDLGGSTDVSPTQKVFLSLYSKGEMFSTDAAFEIADVLSLKSVRRVSGGIYEIQAKEYSDSGMQTVTYTINAIKAINEMKSVNCGGEFDCDASNNFASKVSVTKSIQSK